MARPKFDKKNSTFYYKIFFENGKKLTGYSKVIGWAEPNNKPRAFNNMILRLAQEGYLDRNEKSKTELNGIRFYESRLPKGKNIVTLAYEHYRIEDPAFEISPFYREVREFLKIYYHQISKGVSVLELYDMLYSTSRFKDDYLFILDGSRFKVFDELDLFVKDLIVRQIYPEGRLLDFYIEYSQKFYDLTPDLGWYDELIR